MTIVTQPLARPKLAPSDDDHEQIVIRQDPATGLRLIVAVHSTVLGPALGGRPLRVGDHVLPAVRPARARRVAA